MAPSPHDLLSPTNYDDDATSLHSTSARSDQESDSDDDNLLRQARTSLEVRTHDEQVLQDESDLEDLVQRTREKQNRRPSALAPIAGLFRSVTRSRERDEEDKTIDDTGEQAGNLPRHYLQSGIDPVKATSKRT